jgi:hypothetical protein
MIVRKVLPVFSTLVLGLILSVTAFGNTANHSRGSNRLISSGPITSYELNQNARVLAFKSQTFQRTLERELNRSYLSSTSLEQRANQLSADFHQAAEDLYSQFSMGSTVEISKVEADRLFQLTDELDEFLSRTPVSRSTLKAWDEMSCELSTLASAYNFTDTRDIAVQYHSVALSQDRIWLWL